MDKAIAEQLWQICRQQQALFANLWTSEERNERKAERYRLQCAAWATAANELYTIVERKEPIINDHQKEERRRAAARRSTSSSSTFEVGKD